MVVMINIYLFICELLFAEWDSLVREAEAIVSQTRRRPTYIETSKGNWDAVRHHLLHNYAKGMVTRIHPLGINCFVEEFHLRLKFFLLLYLSLESLN